MTPFIIARIVARVLARQPVIPANAAIHTVTAPTGENLTPPFSNLVPGPRFLGDKLRGNDGINHERIRQVCWQRL